MDFRTQEAIGLAHGYARLDEDGRLDAKLEALIDAAADKDGWYSKDAVVNAWNCSDDGCIRNRRCGGLGDCFCGAECGCCADCGATTRAECICCWMCDAPECECEEDAA